MKIYTVRVNDRLPVGLALWYRGRSGEEFIARLSINENSHGKAVPVFKLSQSPFFHIYPEHCTVIGEANI